MTLDICFNDSFAGVLILHNGSRKSVASLGQLYLDVGDLSDGVFSDKRKAAVNALENDPWFCGKDLFDEDFWEAQKDTLNDIISFAKCGEKLRVWYSMDAINMCSFMFLMSELRDIDCDLHAICLQACPNWLEYTGGSWGCVDRHYIDEFLFSERKVLVGEREVYARKWREICSQGWELRTFLNGAVTGVPTDFFDGLLLSFIPEGEFRMMDILGNLICSISGEMQYAFWRMRLTTLLHTDGFEVTMDEPKGHAQELPINSMRFRKKSIAENS